MNFSKRYIQSIPSHTIVRTIGPLNTLSGTRIVEHGDCLGRYRIVITDVEDGPVRFYRIVALLHHNAMAL
jgi:hypothetical protein